MAAVALIAAGICFAVAWVAMQRRSTAGRIELIWLMLAMGGWSMLQGLLPFVSNLATKITLNTWQYSMIISVPMLWLLVARRAVGFTFMGWWRTVLLAIIPLSAIVLAWTNARHQLIWQTIEPVGARLVFSYGPWFWVAVAYAYLLMLTTLVVLLHALWRAPPGFRMQIYALLLACCIPWLSNLIYLSEVISIPGFDLTPIGFALTGLIAAWALIRQQIFDLLPIARDVLIEQLSDGVLVLDQQRRIVDYNPAARRICVCARGMLGQPLAAVLPDLAGPIEQAIASSTTRQLEAYGPHAVSLELRAMPLPERDDGQPSGWLVVLHDISEQQELLRRLRAEHDFASQVMQTMGEGLTVTDAAGRFTFVNNAYARIFGHAPADLIGRSPYDLTIDEEHAALREVHAMRRTGRSSTYLSRLRRGDGKLATVQITGSPRFQDDEFIGMVAVITDLSERIAQETALRTAEQTLRSIFNSVNAMMGIVELGDNDILHITDNPVTARFFNTSPEAMRGQWDSALGAPPAATARWIEAYRESAQRSQPVEFDYVHDRPEGSHWLAVTVSYIGPAASGRTRFSYMASDITLRKRMEQQLLDTQRQLEAANAQLRELACTDGLTGLHNRSAFDDRLASELARALRHPTPLTLLLIDIDHFKRYNDTYGHQAGDEVLRKVAHIFRAQMRRNDMAARYGGEEFALILPDTDAANATTIAERIRFNIEHTSTFACTITVSIGLATCCMPQTPAQLIEHADTALYAAKHQGRNQVCHAPQQNCLAT